MGKVVVTWDDLKAERRTAALGVAAPFIFIALAVGGAGTRYPLLEMTVELASLPVLFYYAAGYGRVVADAWARVAIGIGALAVLLPVLQLVPLPPEIWTKLPGRRDTHQLLDLIGAAKRWMPISLDREATWRAWLELLPGFAAFVAVLALRTAERVWIILLVIFFAIVTVIVGAFQAAWGDPFVLFESSHAGLATGLFTNRNHQALFLNVAALLAASVGRLRQREHAGLPPLVSIGLVLLFTAGVLATGSRSGVALLLVSVPLALVIMWSTELKSRLIVFPIAGASAVAIMALGTSAGETTLARFASTSDARFAYWPDVWMAIAEYWPIGSGLGTFSTVYQRFESLASVGPTYVNHAHNDYLELLLEGGVFALLLLIVVVAFLALAWARVFRAKGGQTWRAFAHAAAVGLLIIMLHSILDYPLRMLSLMTVFGMLSALLFAPPDAGDRRLQ